MQFYYSTVCFTQIFTASMVVTSTGLSLCLVAIRILADWDPILFHFWTGGPGGVSNRCQGHASGQSDSDLEIVGRLQGFESQFEVSRVERDLKNK